jgi:tetratricopeptide (TPR) repeat protein
MLYKLFVSSKKFWREGGINQAIFLLIAGILIIGLSFGAFYYWDRYLHLGDQSPLEMGVEHLEEMVKDDPQNLELRLSLAQYYYDNGLHQEAIGQSQQVLNVYTDHEGALFLSGMAHYQSEQYDIALDHLKAFANIRRQSQMASSDSRLEMVLYFLGENYNRMGNSTAAIAVLSEALEINRFDADAMFQLGAAYAQTEQHELALEYYHQAVRFVPDFTEAYHGMVLSYQALEDSDHMTYARGMEAFCTGELDKALSHLSDAAEHLPLFAPTHLGLGLVLEQLGEFEAAINSLEEALDLEPNNFMASTALGRIKLRQNNGNS